MLTETQKKEFIGLLKKYQQQQATPEEIAFLESYYQYFDPEEKQSLKLSPQDGQLLEDSMYHHIEKTIHAEEKPLLLGKKPVIYFWQKIAAAILFLLFSGVSIYFLRKSSIHQSTAKIRQDLKRYRNDLAPGTNKAVLTLADGSSIVLDTVQNGNLARQGSAKIFKFNGGTVAYQSRYNPDAKTGTEEIKYNTVSTPNGGQYQIILADGSKVWLNAASSLHFPTSFTGNDREVELQGEAYFEIAKQKRDGKNGTENIPFIVHTHGVQVQVLGTHFNINAYENESAVKTTLLEGSVKVIRGSSSMVLKPGNQSEVDKDGHMKSIALSHVEDAVAWKNGMFLFRSADIETIMRQIARWYNVDVEYSGKVDEKFYVEIPRNTRASELFKIFETTGAVHFEIDGRKVKVLP
jgi:transmembrane sensor